MAQLLAAELLGSLQVYDYRKCIPYISIGSGISRAEYETREDYSRWQIDTSLTFRGKKCKTLNWTCCSVSLEGIVVMSPK